MKLKFLPPIGSRWAVKPTLVLCLVVTGYRYDWNGRGITPHKKGWWVLYKYVSDNSKANNASGEMAYWGWKEFIQCKGLKRIDNGLERAAMRI